MYLLSFIFIIVVTSAIIIILFVITNAEQYVTLVIVTNCFIKNTFYDWQTIGDICDIKKTNLRNIYT